MTQTHEIEWFRLRIGFRLRRTKRRTLAITVKPDGSVEVTAPERAALENVLAKVRKRAGWIIRQQRFFEEFLPPTPPRRYVSGETHRYLGRQYRLKVVEAAAAEVKLRGRFIWVHTPRPHNSRGVQKLVDTWYADHARDRFERSMRECAGKLARWLPEAPKWRVKRMHKRWGSWTPRGGVWLNPELVKAPASCIDYVVTHELCHAVHGNHGKKFYALLRRVMPDWEVRKARLERMNS